MAPLDVIVIGTGGVGSAALYHLARRGARVLGLDRFPPGHARGSSHGDTRIIRLGYLEHPAYVPLLRRSYTLWDELAEAVQRPLIHRTGLIQVGLPGGPVISGLEASVAAHGLEVESFAGEELSRRFGGFRAAPGAHVIYERVAGYLEVEHCVVAHASLAASEGARIHIGEEVRSIRAEPGAVTVVTDREQYRAARAVLSPGAWAASGLGALPARLRVVRKSLFWFQVASHDYDVERGAPAFLFETPRGVYYGFPKVDSRGLKVAEHSGGSEVADPLNVDRSLDRQELMRVQAFIEQHLPNAKPTFASHAVCMYTMTPDEHFLVGLHPAHPEIAFVAGLSGHGFKFTPVLGEIMAELALTGRTSHSIDFLSPSRPM